MSQIRIDHDMLSVGAPPRYRLEEQLGEGGMGVVHAATMMTPAGERRVAIKRLSGPPRSAPGAARERLLAEGRLVFQLTHANICQVIDIAEGEDDAAYIVMEYINGADLARVLRRRGRLELSHALYIGREVARALDYAHRKVDARGRSLRIIHGDVTARNVLLSIEGEVKLADFGISRALGMAAPGSEVVAGTPGFAAPEVQSGIFDERVDVYGLGVCIYVALTGIRPAHAEFAPDDLARARPEVSRALHEIVARATARNPGDRFLSAGALEEALAIELSRTAPGFRPSQLAEVVRAEHATPDRRARSHGGTVLRSVAATTVRDPSIAVRPDSPGATRTVPRTKRWLLARMRVAVPLLIVAAVVTAAVLWIAAPWRDERSSVPPRVASVPSIGPPATPMNAPPADSPAPEQPATRTREGDPTSEPRKHAPQRTERSTPASSAVKGHVTVTADPWGIVFVDGARVADETPVFDLALPAGRHEIKVYFPSLGRSSTPQRLDLKSGGKKTLVFRP